MGSKFPKGIEKEENNNSISYTIPDATANRIYTLISNILTVIHDTRYSDIIELERLCLPILKYHNTISPKYETCKKIYKIFDECIGLDRDTTSIICEYSIEKKYIFLEPLGIGSEYVYFDLFNEKYSPFYCYDSYIGQNAVYIRFDIDCGGVNIIFRKWKKPTQI